MHICELVRTLYWYLLWYHNSWSGKVVLFRNISLFRVENLDKFFCCSKMKIYNLFFLPILLIGNIYFCFEQLCLEGSIGHTLYNKNPFSNMNWIRCLSYNVNTNTGTFLCVWCFLEGLYLYLVVYCFKVYYKKRKAAWIQITIWQANLLL